ncbi:glycoside hydrolase family protein [Gemmatimonadota bacterium]
MKRPAMNITGRVLSILLISGLVTACGQAAAPPLEDDLDLRAMLQPLPGGVITEPDSLVFRSPAVLEHDRYFVWGGSVIRGEDGRFHMFCSLFDADIRFSDSWLLSSRIAWAVSEYPDRGFVIQDILLAPAGESGNRDAWDARTVHNPHVRRFGRQVYLYFIGSRDPGQPEPGEPGHETDLRNRVQLNQKIGVIKARSVQALTLGEWERPAAPLMGPRTRVAPHTFDPSPEDTVPLPDNLIVVNPSIVRRPADGAYLLYFKGNIYDPNWRGVHGVAIGDSPTGTFSALDPFLFETELPDGTVAKNAEDPFVWFDHRRRRFYAIVKDFTGLIGGERSCLVLFTSPEGIDWEPARHPLVSRRRLIFEDGSEIEVQHLERPQLLLDRQGQPLVLYCACTPGNGYAVPGPTVNVQISLLGREPAPD